MSIFNKFFIVNKTIHFDHDEIVSDDSEDLESLPKAKPKPVRNPEPKASHLETLSKVEKYLDQNWCISDEEVDQEILNVEEVLKENEEIKYSEGDQKEAAEEQVVFDAICDQKQEDDIQNLFNIEYIKQKVQQFVSEEVNIL